jgi:hypothetical protein
MLIYFQWPVSATFQFLFNVREYVFSHGLSNRYICFNNSLDKKADGFSISSNSPNRSKDFSIRNRLSNWYGRDCLAAGQAFDVDPLSVGSCGESLDRFPQQTWDTCRDYLLTMARSSRNRA